ncbi:FkbM family methyltransferase [Spirosoma sp. 48-14]|uniref:FkbM family methyltransferase n=1 Tax=Spirosoma sp. 48-14 TaxID=1895854 RepID=UPI00095945C5|nr:FkbM family methyltransferase [Spirosoma sp. 48-14]OJW75067.1 MAG: hypothetical protein BGO59_19030 [Spirosoma sp. 48-14]
MIRIWNKLINKIRKILINKQYEKKENEKMIFIQRKLPFRETNNEYIITYNNKEIHLRKLGSDNLVFHQVIYSDEYAVVKSILKLNNIIVKNILDCGANIGLTTIEMSICFPNANIVSIEPDKLNFKQLCLNTKEYENVYCEECAIWYEERTLYLDESFRDNLEWSRRTIEKSKTGAEVKGTTIEQILNKYNIDVIDLLKIDIEGAEKYLFDKVEYLSFLENTRVIAIEIHDEFKVREKIYRYLQSFGFMLFNSNELTIGVKLK